MPTAVNCEKGRFDRDATISEGNSFLSKEGLASPRSMHKPRILLGKPVQNVRCRKEGVEVSKRLTYPRLVDPETTYCWYLKLFHRCPHMILSPTVLSIPECSSSAIYEYSAAFVFLYKSRRRRCAVNRKGTRKDHPNPAINFFMTSKTQAPCDVHPAVLVYEGF